MDQRSSLKVLQKLRAKLGSTWRNILNSGRAGSVMTTGQGQGLLFYAGESNADYETGANEIPVQNAIASWLSPGGVFVDIGANVGFFSVLAARLTGASGHVYAFEPVHKNAAVIRSNLKRNDFHNVTVIEAAVADRQGPGTLVMADYAGGAALDFVDAPPDAAGSVAVDIITLDDFLSQEGRRPPTLVKIDVEGAELAVLMGMTNTLATTRPVVIVEVDDSQEERLRTKLDACKSLLEGAGYDISILEDSYPDIKWHVTHLLAVPGQA